MRRAPWTIASLGFTALPSEPTTHIFMQLALLFSPSVCFRDIAWHCEEDVRLLHFVLLISFLQLENLHPFTLYAAFLCSLGGCDRLIFHIP